MNLDVLRSAVHFSKWRDANGSVSLSFDVVPEGRQYIEIGDEYLFASSSYAWMHGKERQLVDASVTVTPHTEDLKHLQSRFATKEEPICGSVKFWPERDDGIEADPPKLFFTVAIDPDMFAEMVRTVQTGAGQASLNVGLDGLEYGWEPDASHLIWKLEEGDDLKPLRTFGYSVERFWTSEAAIRDERDRKTNASLADSPDPEDRKLATVSAADKAADPVAALLKECRALLGAILVVGAFAAWRTMT